MSSTMHTTFVSDFKHRSTVREIISSQTTSLALYIIDPTSIIVRPLFILCLCRIQLVFNTLEQFLYNHIFANRGSKFILFAINKSKYKLYLTLTLCSQINQISAITQLNIALENIFYKIYFKKQMIFGCIYENQSYKCVIIMTIVS